MITKWQYFSEVNCCVNACVAPQLLGETFDTEWPSFTVGKDFGSVSCVPVDFNRQEAQEQRLNEAKRQNTQSRLLGKRSLAAAVGRRATLPVVRRAHFLIVDQIVRYWNSCFVDVA